MNVLLIVIDSLRKRSLGYSGVRTPFLDRLSTQTVVFERAYSPECWTLPSHLSMFTGLLPSEHGAHFQSMSYVYQAPTLAELLAEAGYATELITRNSIFDGSLPGVTRGFQTIRRPLRELGRGLEPLLLVLLALAKPRVRRLIRSSGFFHIAQKQDAAFLRTLARMGLPADELTLACALERMAHHKRTATPSFQFLNLYDVHAPYSPSATSPLRPIESPRDLLENLALPRVLPKISNHGYLRDGFRISRKSQQMLLSRYHCAIELMDQKLERFFAQAKASGLLEDTLLVITSDHGEAFGEHGLYLHDASVFETNLHVPLWVHHPRLAPVVVHEPVSTRKLFDLIRAVALENRTRSTILDPVYREQTRGIAAEHFRYPASTQVAERYRHNLAAIIVDERKFVRRGESLEMYDLSIDRDEAHPTPATLQEVGVWCRRAGLPVDRQEELLSHLGAGRLGFSRAA